MLRLRRLADTPPPACTVFRRLGAFASGFSLEAAQGVCADENIADWDVIDLLGSLLEKSLVIAEAAEDQQRYRLLESTRAYALERLAEHDEVQQLREKHARWYLAWAEQNSAARISMSWRLWVARTLLEIDNFRAALEWWLTDNRNAPDAATLIAHTGDALRGGQESELWRWCDSTLAALGPDAADALIAPLLVSIASVSGNLGYGREQRAALIARGVDVARAAGDRRTLAQALVTTAFNLNIAGQYDAALATVREGLEYAKSVGDRHLVANALMREAMSIFPSDNAQGRKLFDEAQALGEACDDPGGCSVTLLNRAECEFLAGDARTASRFARAALAIRHKMKQGVSLATLLCNAAAYNVALGEFDEARTVAQDSLRAAREEQARQVVAFVVQHLAAVALHNGDLRSAARLIGWCDAYLKAIDEIRQSTEQTEYDQLVADLQKALSAEQFRSLLAEGAMLSEDAACEEALRV